MERPPHGGLFQLRETPRDGIGTRPRLGRRTWDYSRRRFPCLAEGVSHESCRPEGDRGKPRQRARHGRRRARVHAAGCRLQDGGAPRRVHRRNRRAGASSRPGPSSRRSDASPMGRRAASRSNSPVPTPTGAPPSAEGSPTCGSCTWPTPVPSRPHCRGWTRGGRSCSPAGGAGQAGGAGEPSQALGSRRSSTRPARWWRGGRIRRTPPWRPGQRPRAYPCLSEDGEPVLRSRPASRAPARARRRARRKGRRGSRGRPRFRGDHRRRPAGLRRSRPVPEERRDAAGQRTPT